MIRHWPNVFTSVMVASMCASTLACESTKTEREASGVKQEAKGTAPLAPIANDDKCIVAMVSGFAIRVAHAREIARAQRPPLPLEHAKRLAVDAAIAVCERNCAELRAERLPPQRWLDDYRTFINGVQPVRALQERLLSQEIDRLARKHDVSAGPCAAENQSEGV